MRSKLSESVRNIMMRLLGTATYYITASRAAVILTSSDANQWKAHLPVRRFAMGGLPREELREIETRSRVRTTHPFRLVSIGRLLGWKGFSMGIRAFARFQNDFPESEYWIIGDGPERRFLGELARKLKCHDKVRFLGWVSRDQLLNLLHRFDVLVHPSLHEQFGYVVLESLAAGIPVISLDVAGPSLLVTDNCGFKLEPSSPSDVVNCLYRSLLQIAVDTKLRNEMGEAAKLWAGEMWNWDRVGGMLLEIYDQLMAEQSVLGTIPQEEDDPFLAASS